MKKIWHPNGMPEQLQKLNIIGKLPMKYKKTYERDESNQGKYSEKYFLIFF